jgi:formate transporter
LHIPSEIKRIAEETGVSKAGLSLKRTMILSILAGVFIAFGAVFSTLVTSGSELSFGVNRLLGGVSFSLGLILVVVGGAELFTGNNLMIIPWASKKISFNQVLRNWSLVYLGNFAGALLVAMMILWSGHYLLANGVIAKHMLEIASKKCELGFVEALTRGILCNMLVCLAIWLSYSTRSFTGKVLAILFPITAFVAAGFEHSVANMYFVPVAILVKNLGDPQLWEMIQTGSSQFSSITWGNFFIGNLLPVSIGNIIGGSLFVGLAYWHAYGQINDPSSTNISVP